MIEVYETLLAYNQAMTSPPSAVEDGENLPSILTVRYTRKVRNYQKGLISLVGVMCPIIHILCKQLNGPDLIDVVSMVYTKCVFVE